MPAQIPLPPETATDPNRCIDGRFYGFIVLFMGIFHFIAGSTILLRGEHYLSQVVTIDDTFYYLQTVWNHKKLGFPTFDGINETNGFHFLWYVILYCSAQLIEYKNRLLPVSVGLGILFNSLSYYFVYRIGKTLHLHMLGLMLASLCFLSTFPPIGNVNGLETSVHYFCFWWVVSEVAIFLSRLAENRKPGIIRLTIPLVFNAWARLDSGLISAVIYVACLYLLFFRYNKPRSCWDKYSRPLLVSITIVCAAAFVQLGFFRIWGGTLIPISGIVKNSNIVVFPGYSFFAKFTDTISSTLPHLYNFESGYYVIGLMVIALIVSLILLHKIEKRDKTFKVLRQLLVILAISSLAFMACLIFSPERRFGYWYFSALRIFWIIDLGTTLYLCGVFIRNNSGKSLSFHFTAATFCISVIVALCLFVYQAKKDLDPGALYRTRYEAALWIKDHIPQGTILASWNSGQLGFFSGRTVINLDGLINSRRYFDEVLKGRTPLSAYLKSMNVRYVVDYYDPTLDKFTRNMTVVHEFAVNPETARGGEPLRIWAVGSLPDGFVGGRYEKR